MCIRSFSFLFDDRIHHARVAFVNGRVFLRSSNSGSVHLVSSPSASHDSPHRLHTRTAATPSYPSVTLSAASSPSRIYRSLSLSVCYLLKTRPPIVMTSLHTPCWSKSLRIIRPKLHNMFIGKTLLTNFYKAMACTQVISFRFPTNPTVISSIDFIIYTQSAQDVLFKFGFHRSRNEQYNKITFFFF